MLSHMLKTFAAVAVLLAASYPAHAFKVDTHVWVGQQVLNDVVADGAVTIGARQYPVAPAIVEALRQYPSEYRMGNIGPDGFPDVVAGQMTTHPGVLGAWKTSDWLRWMLTGAPSDPRAVAFNLGYVAHAAADIFAHSYVNTYAGDIFLLTDDEQEVEVRHFALEKYIALRTPPFQDHNGNGLGPLEGLVTTPASYVRDRLVFNDEVNAQYKAEPVRFITPHVAVMYDLYKDIGGAIEKVNRIESVIDLQIVKYQERIREVEDKILHFISEIERLNNEILIKTSLINLNKQIIEQKKLLIQQKLAEIDFLMNLIADLQNLLAQRNALVDEFQNKLANTVKETCEQFCPPSPPGCGGFLQPPCPPNPCQLICKLTDAWIDINNKLQDAIAARDQVALALAEKVFLKQAAEQAKAAAEAAIAALNLEIAVAEEAIRIATALIEQHQAALEQARADLLKLKRELEDTLALKPAHVLALRALLTNWQRDVGLAVEAYMEASGDIMKEVLKAHGEPLAPLQRWLDCWSPVFQGIPKDIPNTVCKVQESIDRLAQAVEDFRASLGDLIWLIDPVGELKRYVLEQLEPELVRASIAVLEKVGQQEMADMVRLIHGGVDGPTLNSIFATDSSRKNLLLINDITQRVDADMHLTPEGYFDPAQYRVAYNAVLLAKLTLLGPAELNQVFIDNVGVLPTVYGVSLYPDPQIWSDGFNVLVDAVRSIDGNQQWQQLGLPYPRRAPNIDPLWPWIDPSISPDEERRYGYGFQAGTQGFRFWEDPTARETLFRNVLTALFKGPVAPGIEYPVEFGLSDILGEDYPFRACKQNPFPRTTNLDGSFRVDAFGNRRDNGCDEDFIVSAATDQRGQQIRLDIVVTNQGARAAPKSEVAVYLSSDDRLDAGDRLLAQHNVQKLAPEESRRINDKVKLGGLPAGRFYLLVVADPFGLVAEAHEDNNVHAIPVTLP